jgi:DNA-directed RNA polymerase specialized sigma24 family protein
MIVADSAGPSRGRRSVRATSSQDADPVDRSTADATDGSAALSQVRWNEIRRLVARQGRLGREDAEDVTSEVFRKTIPVLAKGGLRGSLDAYLYRAALNQLRTTLAGRPAHEAARTEVLKDDEPMSDLPARNRLFQKGIGVEEILKAEELHAVFLFAARQWLQGTREKLPPPAMLSRQLGLWDEYWIPRFFERHLARLVYEFEFSERQIDLKFFYRRHYCGEKELVIARETIQELEDLLWQADEGAPDHQIIRKVLASLRADLAEHVKRRLRQFREWLERYFEHSGYQALGADRKSSRAGRPAQRGDRRDR